MKQSLHEEDFLFLLLMFVLFLLFMPGMNITIIALFIPTVLFLLLAFVGCVAIGLFIAVTFFQSLMQPKKISEAPGSILLSIVEFLYRPTTVEHTFRPIIADWRVEYFDALQQGRVLKARWITFRYTYSFITAMCASKVLSFIKMFKSASR